MESWEDEDIIQDHAACTQLSSGISPTICQGEKKSYTYYEIIQDHMSADSRHHRSIQLFD
jgi:hypothetical protein